MRTRSLGLALGLVFVCGCGGTTGTHFGPTVDMTISFGPPPDMVMRPDLTTPDDLTAPPDLAGPAYCKGTSVEGTCAQTYFASVNKCFVATGACTNNMPVMNASNTCWQSGAMFSATYDMVTMMAHGTWKSMTTTCMSADVSMGGGGQPVFHFTAPGGMLVYDEGTGDVTCPNGSKANIGPKYGMCTELATLVGVPMNNCVKGACP